MTPTEFKAWFDGFTEGLAGLPNEDQWARIRARVAEIDGHPISYPVYVDRYIRPYWGSIYPYTYWGTGGPQLGNACGTVAMAQTALGEQNFNSTTAMYALGRDESVITYTAN